MTPRHGDSGFLHWRLHVAHASRMGVLRLQPAFGILAYYLLARQHPSPPFYRLSSNAQQKIPEKKSQGPWTYACPCFPKETAGTALWRPPIFIAARRPP